MDKPNDFYTEIELPAENPARIHGRIQVQVHDETPRQIDELLTNDFERFIQLFNERTIEYGDHAFLLGSRGQFADMSRKMGKLKTGIWDDNHGALVSEGVEEVVLDMIGHCFLTLQCLRREGKTGKALRGKGENPELITGLPTFSESIQAAEEMGVLRVDWDGEKSDTERFDLSEVSYGQTPETRLARAQEELAAAERAVREQNYDKRNAQA